MNPWSLRGDYELSGGRAGFGPGHKGRKVAATTYRGAGGDFTLSPEQTNGKAGPLSAVDPATGRHGDRISVVYFPKEVKTGSEIMGRARTNGNGESSVLGGPQHNQAANVAVHTPNATACPSTYEVEVMSDNDVIKVLRIVVAALVIAFVAFLLGVDIGKSLERGEKFPACNAVIPSSSAASPLY